MPPDPSSGVTPSASKTTATPSTSHSLPTNQLESSEQTRSRLPHQVLRLPSLLHSGATGMNLNTILTEHKRATRNGDVNNHIAEHHRLTNHTIDCDSAQSLTSSTNYFKRLTLESWFTNLEQTPLNRCQQLPAPHKRLTHDINITNESNRTT